MQENPGPVYIIFIDHGSPDKFYLSGTEDVTASELNNWLNSLQTGMIDADIDQPLVIILGACYSGSFIDNLSGSGRVIVSSSASDEPSYRGTEEPHKYRDGELFVSSLFNELGQGHDLRESFETATRRTEIYTDSGYDALNPYFDTSVQHPQLDDNGDKEGSNYFASADNEGDTAKTIILGYGTPSDAVLIEKTGRDAEDIFWAKVSDMSRTEAVWAEIRDPKKRLEKTGGGEPKLQKIAGFESKILSRDDEKGRYKITYSDFPDPGRYTLFFYARDKEGIISPFAKLYAYKKNDQPNAPPSEFSLFYPPDSGTVRTSILFDWGDSADPDGLTYTLLISQDETFSDPIRKEGLAYSICLVSEDDGIADSKTYYWKVEATDEYGAVQESETRIFQTNNTNPLPMWVGGRVYYNPSEETEDEESGEVFPPVAFASVSIKNIMSLLARVFTDFEGYYLFQIDQIDRESGDEDFETSIEVTKEYYEPAETELTIPAKQINDECGDIVNAEPEGDINGDGQVDFGDIISKLEARCPERVIRKEDIGLIPLCRDISGNGSIDMKDIISVLKTLAGMESEIKAEAALSGKIGLDDAICILQILSVQ